MLRRFPFLNHFRKATPAPSALQEDIPHLPDLILAAGKLAVMLQPGRHGQRRYGTGEDFWQFRPYNPPEPASLIDWKQSARSLDETMLWVREREKQTPRPLMLWVDPSPSMKWRSTQTLPTKYETALTAALALGQAALHAGESVATLEQRRFFTGTHFLPRLALNLSHIQGNFPNFRLIPPHATIMIVSDFLWDDATLEKLARECRNRPGKTGLLAILDPAECNFPYSGSLKFTSEEAEPSLELTSDEIVQKHYQAILRRHLETLVQLSHKYAGVFYFLHHNEKPLLPSLMSLKALLGDKA
ncbi:DUF58 domain-containing protein [Acetobacteraceae bacterium ESL0709]|nr:DUF58 domain-containing protein [Acetobacteraceae bacterium ESL0697]MDF7678648.1 DUF58 domain-containing protein [Acetobacteraceae bacterium ESL0709]